MTHGWRYLPFSLSAQQNALTVYSHPYLCHCSDPFGCQFFAFYPNKMRIHSSQFNNFPHEIKESDAQILQSSWRWYYISVHLHYRQNPLVCRMYVHSLHFHNSLYSPPISLNKSKQCILSTSPYLFRLLKDMLLLFSTQLLTIMGFYLWNGPWSEWTLSL